MRGPYRVPGRRSLESQCAHAVTTEMGPGIAARPHMRRVWIYRCSLSCKARGPPAFSILTHQLRRRFQPGWIRGSSPLRSSPHPEGWLASRRCFASARRLWHPELPRPFLGWPPSRGLASLGGKPPSQRRDLLFRRLLPTGPVLKSAASSPRGAVQLRISQPSPAGGDRTFGPVLSFRSLPTFWRGWDFRPDHHWNMRMIPSRAKRNLRHQACG